MILIYATEPELTLKTCKALASVPTSSLTRNWIIFVLGVPSTSNSAVSAFKENNNNIKV
jgi:hypothetical protein